jgi:hypothetical protein
MAFPRIGGAGIALNLNNALGSAQQFGSQILSSSGFTQSQGSDVVTLAASQTFIIPAGTYLVSTGPYTSLQWLEPVSNAGLNTNTNLTSAVNGIWRTCNADLAQRPMVIDSDGGNWRLANLTGCPVGAAITNAGSGGTNGIGQAATGMVVAPSAGGSTWVPVVGGALTASGATITGGSNYQYAPTLVIGAPPPGGVQATATCTISANAVNAITFTNNGAGYLTAPPVTIINDSRDAVGTGAAIALAAPTGSGTLTALYPVNHGTNLTATPTFSTLTGVTSAAATIIMNYVVTGWANGTAGAGYLASAQLWATVVPGLTPTLAANTVNPIVGTGTNTASTGGQTLGQPFSTAFRPAQITQLITSGGATQASSAAGTINDAGFGYPNTTGTMLLMPIGTAGTYPTTIAVQAPSFGGIVDTSWLQPI